jgi:guanylate kinase
MSTLRRTKIVATLGPSTDDQATLVAMIRAGVDGVRINCSHGSRGDFIRRACERQGIEYHWTPTDTPIEHVLFDFLSARLRKKGGVARR